MKRYTLLSQIKVLHEQLAEAARQNGYEFSTSTSHNNDVTYADKLGSNWIYGWEYNYGDEDFSYHSLDGSAEEDADDYGELGQDAVGTLPMATAGGKKGDAG